MIKLFAIHLLQMVSERVDRVPSPNHKSRAPGPSPDPDLDLNCDRRLVPNRGPNRDPNRALNRGPNRDRNRVLNRGPNRALNRGPSRGPSRDRGLNPVRDLNPNPGPARGPSRGRDPVRGLARGRDPSLDRVPGCALSHVPGLVPDRPSLDRGKNLLHLILSTSISSLKRAVVSVVTFERDLLPVFPIAGRGRGQDPGPSPARAPARARRHIAVSFFGDNTSICF